jgi:hypothetical protein
MKRILFLIFLGFFLTQGGIAQTTITMQKEGGVYVVPCVVNGLKLKFIFDTGASNVTISLTEAIFMLKNDYLDEKDIYGTTYAQLANGEITENTKIVLRKIEFAGLTLMNVEAAVVHELSAPLLLGQTAISKLGKIQLDPENNTLTILNGKREASTQTLIAENKVKLKEKARQDSISAALAKEQKDKEEAERKKSKQNSIQQAKRDSVEQAKIDVLVKAGRNREMATTSSTPSTEVPKVVESDYKDGVTEEKIPESNRTIERTVIKRFGEFNNYQKIIYNWGGIFYYRNESPMTATAFVSEINEAKQQLK